MVEYWKLKNLVLKHYGNKCTKCGETDPKQLRVIFADESMQSWRKKFGLESTKDFYYFLYRNNFPDKYKEGKYRLIVLCRIHYNEFASSIRKGIPRSEEVKAKISKTMRSRT